MVAGADGFRLPLSRSGPWERVQPLQVSWGWTPDPARLDEPDEYGSSPRLRFLELEGTRDICPWLTVPDAIRFQEEIGRQRIQERIGELTRYVRGQLTGLCGLTVATPANPTSTWRDDGVPLAARIGCSGTAARLVGEMAD